LVSVEFSTQRMGGVARPASMPGLSLQPLIVGRGNG
jgi:hypothetical protein